MEIKDISEQDGERLLESAKRVVRKMLIIKLVADQNGIKVDDTKLNEYLKSIASREGRTPESLRAELEKNDRIDHIKSRLLENETLDFLLKKAEVTVEEHTEEEKSC